MLDDEEKHMISVRGEEIVFETLKSQYSPMTQWSGAMKKVKQASLMT